MAIVLTLLMAFAFFVIIWYGCVFLENRGRRSKWISIAMVLLCSAVFVALGYCAWNILL